MFRLAAYLGVACSALIFVFLLLDVEGRMSWSIGALLVWGVAAVAGLGLLLTRRGGRSPRRHRRKTRHAIAAHGHAVALSTRPHSLRIEGQPVDDRGRG